MLLHSLSGHSTQPMGKAITGKPSKGTDSSKIIIASLLFELIFFLNFENNLVVICYIYIYFYVQNKLWLTKQTGPVQAWPGVWNKFKGND